jgi:hypothetical protein
MKTLYNFIDIAITENDVNMLNNSLESDSFDIAQFDKLYQTVRSNKTL